MDRAVFATCFLAWGLLDTHRQVWFSLLWGHCSFLLAPGAHKVLFVPSKSLPWYQGLPDSSVGKELTCNRGDSSSISGSGRSTAEVIDYPLQYSWTSLVAQLVKNLPSMGETRVWFLGWEDPLEKGTATHSSILDWRIQWTVFHGVAKSWTWVNEFHFPRVCFPSPVEVM